MTERLIHQRTKGPVSTPAQRVIELTNQLGHTERLLAEAQARVAELERLTPEVLKREYDRYHRMTDTSFGGIRVSQWNCDLILWEAMLNENPDLRAIFELGTWWGGFSWWLWAQTQAREMVFHTFDTIVPPYRTPPDAFTKIDIFAEHESLGGLFREHEPCVVFCDNGNKPRELKIFSQELRSRDSLLIVHDWGTEFLPTDVPNNVEEVYGEFCDEIGSFSRVFRIKV